MEKARKILSQGRSGGNAKCVL